VETLKPWRALLATSFFLPVLTFVFQQDFFHIWPASDVPGRMWVHLLPGGKILNATFLVFPVLILMNLERTFRAAIGTTRWRIKFVLIGVGIIFGARFYVRTEAMIFSGHNLALHSLESAAVLIGSAFIVAGYVRGGFADTDLYPSRAALQMSLTLVLAGTYLFLVGVLAPIVARFGAQALFPSAALFVLTAIILLTLLLISERLRQKIRLFVSRHFKRPQHDFRDIWTKFTRTVAPGLDEERICGAACRLVCEAFNVLSVSIWRVDQGSERLVRIASTAATPDGGSGPDVTELPAPGVHAPDLQWPRRPLDLERSKDRWLQQFRVSVTGRFREGGHRFCVPLGSADERIGLLLLADRVGGVPFTAEEFDLLACVADQLAASLTNVRLAREIMAAKEIQAFQTMSAFFVHDLKNTASSLGLMLQNFEEHFEDPAFREDMLRGIKNANERINQLIASLSGFRGRLELSLAPVDLNALVKSALTQLNGAIGKMVTTDLESVPELKLDAEKMQSVLTNLILNARDAVGSNGTIAVKTGRGKGGVILAVCDNGVGMSEAFINESLFKPFQTTKKKGLGIGLFQARMIVEAHHGTIQVHSTPGTGTMFEIVLPIEISR
jgi:putative PEP-CTERM system histidine kinase